MCTPNTIARILSDGRSLQIKHLVGKLKQRTKVPYRTAILGANVSHFNHDDLATYSKENTSTESPQPC